MKDEPTPEQKQKKKQVDALQQEASITPSEEKTLEATHLSESTKTTEPQEPNNATTTPPRLSGLERMEKLASIFANLLVIGGIIFAGFQYCQTERLDKKAVALDAIAAAKSAELLSSIKRLKMLSEPIIEIDTTRLLKLIFSNNLTESEDSEAKAALFIQIDSAYQRAYQSPENWPQVADDFNLVFARYNEAARLYYYKMGDRTIIGESMKDQVSTFYNILIRWPYLTSDVKERHDGTTLKRFLDLVNSSQ